MTVNDDYDVCCCGDYRHQHVDGTGRCKLGSLCTPWPCGKFRLFQRATLSLSEGAHDASTLGNSGTK